MYMKQYLETQDTLVLIGGIQIGSSMIKHIGKGIQKQAKEEAIWQDQVATHGKCTRKTYVKEKLA